MQSSFWLITSISTTQIYALPIGDCCSNSTQEWGGERAHGVYLDEKIFFSRLLLNCVALKCSGHCACVTWVCNSFWIIWKSFILLHSHAVRVCYQSISVQWIKQTWIKNWADYFFLSLPVLLVLLCTLQLYMLF